MPSKLGLALLALALLGGCALIFGGASVHLLRLNTALPEELSVAPRIKREVAYCFTPLEDTEEMVVKTPDGHFYEFNVNAALDSLAAQLVAARFTAVTDSAADTLFVSPLSTEMKVEQLDPRRNDFRLKLGFVVELRTSDGYAKSIVYADETAVHDTQKTTAALTGMVDGLLLKVVTNMSGAITDACSDSTP